MRVRGADKRILAIDPRASLAEAYGHRLGQEDGYVFLGVLTDAGVTHEAIERLHPDVCLVNLLLRAGQDVAQVLQDIRKAHSGAKRLVIADVEACGSAVLAAALEADPEGFFCMDEGLDELVAAVGVVADGGRRVASDFLPMANRARQVVDLFSKGERRVVCALAQFGNKEAAADATFYSTETVNTYVRRIRKRVAEYEGRDSVRLPDLIAWSRRHGFHRVIAT